MDVEDIEATFHGLYILALRHQLRLHPWELEHHFDRDTLHPHDLKRLLRSTRRLNALAELIGDAATVRAITAEYEPRRVA